MTILFEHIDTSLRSYHGISVEEQQCRIHLQGAVKDNLIDREEKEEAIDELKSLLEETGFHANKELLTDIQAIENPEVEVQNFRIGEAYAEVILEQEFDCRFHWNENRDARNPKGNKTGADLVGFIEVDEQVLFLFGEVKTSSEIANRPPQVMTGADGMEKQLNVLYEERNKRQILIAYLQNKARLYPEEHSFRIDCEASIRAYYAEGNYQLIGVLVRDVDVDENDISISYERLSTHILEPNGIKLVALYLPIKQSDWQSILNESVE